MNKILIIVGMAVIGGLSGGAIVFPEQAVLLSALSASVATVIGIITGVSLKKD